VTHLRCGGKYDTSLVANLLLAPTVKEFLKWENISQSYERILSGTFFIAHGVTKPSRQLKGEFNLEKYMA